MEAKLKMKMTSDPYSFGGNEGIRFKFRDWDFTHEETLVLKSDGNPAEGIHRNPLYALQAVASGEMVEVTFVLTQTRLQDARDGGGRDRVRDRIGVRIDAVRPLQQASENGTGDKAPAGAGAGRGSSS